MLLIPDFPSFHAVLNVRDLGAVADGVADDITAIDNAQIAVHAAGGGELFFPAGTYLIGGSTTGLIYKASNITYRGAGMHATTLRRGAFNGPMFQASSGFLRHNIVFEDMCFDGAWPNITTTYLHALLPYLQQVTFRRCRFIGLPAGAISINACPRVTIEDCLFDGQGSHRSTMVLLQNAPKNTTIRNNQFRYFFNGILGDTGSLSIENEHVTEFLTITGNYFDGGWWTAPVRGAFSGSGATVSYTGTVLTDSAAAFSGLGALDTVRLMPLRQAGTMATAINTRVIDASATFITNGVRRGDILRTGTAMGVVANVWTETELQIEEWLSDAARTPVDAPSLSPAAYSVYGTILGQRSASTGTTITVARWFDLDGTTVAAPAAETRYEVLPTHPNYPLHFEYSGRYLQVTGNVFRRGWSDQCSIFGSRSIVADNIIEDGQDAGITIHGSHNVVSGNTVRHQGALGIFTASDDSSICGNVVMDTQWVNSTNTVSSAGIQLTGANRNVVSGNKVHRVTAAHGYHGILIDGSSVVSTGNLIIGNVCTGHLTYDVKIYGANATSTRLRENIRSTYSDTGTSTDTSVITGKLVPLADAVTGIVVTKADGSTVLVTIDTTNGRVGIGGTPDYPFEVISDAPAPGYFNLNIKPKSGASVLASAVGIESRYLSTTQRWFFGTGTGGGTPNNYFRIVDATAGNIDRFYIIPGGGAGVFVGSLGINGAPNANAALDVQSTTKAFMPPRMTTVQKDAIASPTAGMVVYDSTLNKLCVRTAAAWETVTSV